jgi:hypothetical protein
MTISSVFTVPKPDATHRGILNLSDHSITTVSVNDCIAEPFRTVVYIWLREIITMMMAVGTDGLLWVKDLEDGFHNVPVRAVDQRRLGIRFQNKYYLFQRLPMGLTSSPHLFTKFMKFPLFAATHDSSIDTHKRYYIDIDSRSVDISVFRPCSDLTQIGTTPFYRMVLVSSYVDDIFGLALSPSQATAQWDHSEAIFERMNLRCKVKKGRPPARVNILLGYEFDLRRQWIRLSDRKYNKYMTLFAHVLTLRYISESILLSVIGKARYASSIYRALSAFARGLEYFIPYAERDVRLGRGPAIRNSSVFRIRLQCVMDCMTIANKHGVPFAYCLRPRSHSFDYTIVTDASLLIGVGGICSDGSYFQNRWTEIDLQIQDVKDRDITWRELIAVYASLLNLHSRHGSQLLGKSIRICTDNEAVKFLLISFSAQFARPDLQVLINHICILCIRLRLHLWLDHIPGVKNAMADALSRFYDQPLTYPQHPDFDVGSVSLNVSDQTRPLLQRGASASAAFLRENNFILQRRFMCYTKNSAI